MVSLRSLTFVPSLNHQRAFFMQPLTFLERLTVLVSPIFPRSLLADFIPGRLSVRRNVARHNCHVKATLSSDRRRANFLPPIPGDLVYFLSNFEMTFQHDEWPILSRKRAPQTRYCHPKPFFPHFGHPWLRSRKKRVQFRNTFEYEDYNLLWSER